MVPLASVAMAADYAPTTRKAVEVDPALAPVGERMAYKPDGVQVGSFTLLPALGLSTGYDTNITATNTNTKEDWLFIVRPSLLLRSDWTRHMLLLDTYFESGSYAKYSDADYQNYSFGARGRIDVTDDFYLTSFLRWSHLNELPGDDEVDTGLTEPLGYDQTVAGVGLRKDFNRMWVTADFKFRDRDFDNFVDGVPSNQQYRDGQTYTVSGRVGYEISPLTSLFVGGGNSWYNMEDSDYNATQWNVVGGVVFEPSRLMRGEAYIGYGEWTSDNGDLSRVPNVNYGLDLAWFVSPLLTVTFSGAQEVLTSNYNYLGFDGSAVLNSTFGVRADYELRRSIILSGWFNYENQNYEDFARDDDQYVYGAQVRYVMNRYAEWKLNYSYTDFDTNFNGINGAESYTRNVILGTLTLTY
ncbi:outer membrane beta-barrel protein [Ancylobacter sp. A5.8]|uniref:outer membrane beta-barrel protein n=1 Tax=Ancylobacter gelatini TaxID=2919920 RepID=UPI001F4E3138|nr:outer membrane beta-barrel protein [Ancylobacter gelatini]MCJ8141378.1 outer membrane beta-barrel protein [Ancylobacter gelatini]